MTTDNTVMGDASTRKDEVASDTGQHPSPARMPTSAISAETMERVAKAICRAAHDTDDDFAESWKEHEVGYTIEAAHAIQALLASGEVVVGDVLPAIRDACRTLEQEGYAGTLLQQALTRIEKEGV